MSHAPYEPPRAPLADAPRPPGAPWRGVLAGLLVDVGGTMAASLLISVVASVWLIRQGATREELQARLSAVDATSSLGLSLLAAGLACSFLGGYVCMRIVRRPEIGAGIVLAALSTAFGAWTSWGRQSTASTVVLGAMGFLCVLIGAWRGRAQPADA